MNIEAGNTEIVDGGGRAVLGRYGRGGAWARRLVGLAGLSLLSACATPETSRTSVASQVMIGEQFLENAEYEKGYSILDAVARDNPASSTAALALADAYFRKGAHLKASAHYTQAVERGADLEGRLGLARVDLARSDADGARTRFEELLTRHPGDVDALNGLGVAHDLAGRHDLAQQQYRAVLARDPTNTKARNNLALSQALGGQPRLALPLLTELAHSNLDDKTIRQNLALVEYMSGNTAAARRLALVDLSEAEAGRNFQSLDQSMGGPTRGGSRNPVR